MRSFFSSESLHARFQRSYSIVRIIYAPKRFQFGSLSYHHQHARSSPALCRWKLCRGFFSPTLQGLESSEYSNKGEIYTVGMFQVNLIQ